jgi:hypothetical protein
MSIKPRLFRHNGRWACARVFRWSRSYVVRDDLREGDTPLEAYKAWKSGDRRRWWQ